jgi:hypothetical protein
MPQGICNEYNIYNSPSKILEIGLDRQKTSR